jgi:hypothetical protein
MFSFLVFAIGEHGVSENLTPFLLKISLPMVALGGCLLYLAKLRSPPSAS